MDKKMTEMTMKWASVVLVIISVSMMFFGWITIADKETRKSVQTEMKSTQKELKLSQEELEEAQEELDGWGLDIDIKKLVKQIKKSINIIKDAKISPCEIATTGPTVYKLANILSDESVLKYYFGSSFDSVLETVENLKGAIIALEILFYLTIIAGIVVIVLHIIGNKLPGISVIALNLLWWIIMGIASHKINVYGKDELHIDDKLVKLTSAPFWAVLFAVLAAVLWVAKEKIAIHEINGVSAAGMNGYSGESASRTCSTCGNILNAGALFCPKCGTKYEDQPSTAEEEQVDKGTFCSNCGTKLTAGSVFCPKCGNRVE